MCADRVGGGPPQMITGGAWLAFLVVCVVWGSTYPAILVMVQSVPPLTGAGSRFVLAGVLLAVFVGVRRSPRLLMVTRREALACALIGLLLLTVGNGLITVSEQKIPSSLTALVVATVPLWMVLFRAMTGDRSRPLGVMGAVLGFSGLALLLRVDANGSSIGWLLLIVVGSASWALGSTIQRRLPLPPDIFVRTAYEMIFGGALLLLAGWIAGESLQLGQITSASATAWVYLTVAGSVLAFSCYSWLLLHSPLSFVSTYAYVNPVVAVFLGVLLLREALPAVVLAGGAVTLVGVIVVVRADAGPLRKPRSPSPRGKPCGRRTASCVTSWRSAGAE